MFLNIYNTKEFRMLGSGNIKGIQLVHCPPKPSVCNWPYIQDWSFSEGSDSMHYSIKRLLVFGGALRIGGDWPKSGIQDYLTVPNKALMVFKLWIDRKVDNGDIDGGEQSSSSRESTADSVYLGDHYERYGSGWQTYESAGYNGTVDAVAISDPEACVYYTFSTGESEVLEVLAHFPPSRQATAAARYDVFVTDYLEGPAGEADLGEPLITTVIDQTDSATYSSAADDEGFVSIGTIEVMLQEPALKSIVIKLSSAHDQTELYNPSSLLISDAVMIRPVE